MEVTEPKLGIEQLSGFMDEKLQKGVKGFNILVEDDPTAMRMFDRIASASADRLTIALFNPAYDPFELNTIWQLALPESLDAVEELGVTTVPFSGITRVVIDIRLDGLYRFGGVEFAEAMLRGNPNLEVNFCTQDYDNVDIRNLVLQRLPGRQFLGKDMLTVMNLLSGESI